MRVVADVKNVPPSSDTTRASAPSLFEQDESRPLILGIWNADDLQDNTTVTEIENNEVKYIISGEATWKDADSGQEFHVSPGSVLWLPKGTRALRVRSRGLAAFYVEQADRPIPAVDEPSWSWVDSLDQMHARVMRDFILGNPKSQGRFQEAVKHIPGGNTRSVLQLGHRSQHNGPCTNGQSHQEEQGSGAGGVIPGTPAFLQFLRDEATRLGAVLIFDEVVTPRLHINGLQGHHRIFPDITTLGKYIGGGPSLGVFGGRANLMDALDPRRESALSHSGTCNNNVFTIATGIAAAKLLAQEKILKANSLGDKLREGGSAALLDCILVAQARLA
ncbi:hypothetical protein QQZ08_009228 [Neonectria magnoliae]|uniref:Aminotransferase class III-fold pyridoxal phosphate-dependent enzyme n=1 Tax=Neonectria magnoliae TaxID=2732573 RepID=A0ABR1HR80_9HYPO